MSITSYVPGAQCHELVDWLVDRVARYLNVSPDAVGTDVPLADHGIDSVTALALCADLNCERGFDVDTTIVWDHPTIDDIASYLLEQRP